MARNLALLALWVLAACTSINMARANTFTATYSELARSPGGCLSDVPQAPSPADIARVAGESLQGVSAWTH